MKSVSTWFNKNYAFIHIAAPTIQAMSASYCSKILTFLAITHQDDAFKQFFNNNDAEQREQATNLFGWSDDEDGYK